VSEPPTSGGGRSGPDWSNLPGRERPPRGNWWQRHVFPTRTRRVSRPRTPRPRPEGPKWPNVPAQWQGEPENEQRNWLRSGWFGRRRQERIWQERQRARAGILPDEGAPDTPPEDRFIGGTPPPYVPQRFDPAFEQLYGSNPGTHGLTPEEDEESRRLFELGFIIRGLGSKYYRDAWFDYTGMDPRNFDWQAWKEEVGSP
jgi:hypothetical protein